ncbi:MAG: DUF6427 family protein [Flavobacteriaceae bacterium]
MLTRFFKQSKPIPLFLTLILLVAYYFFHHISQDSFSKMSSLKLVSNLGLIAFIILFIRFIIQKNNFQKTTNYSIFCFFIFLIIFPETLTNINMSLGLLFNLFAFRRMLSMHSNIDLKKKIFDVGFWCFFATLYWPPSLLLLVIAIVAVLFYASDNFRFYILPFLGFTSALILHYTYSVLRSKPINYLDKLPVFTWNPDLNYTLPDQLKLYFLIAISLFLLIYLPKIYQGLKLNMQRSLSLFLIIYTLYAFALIFNVNDDFSQMLFLITPLAIVSGNFLQLNQLKLLWKELFLWALIAVAIAFYFI